MDHNGGRRDRGDPLTDLGAVKGKRYTMWDVEEDDGLVKNRCTIKSISPLFKVWWTGT